MAEGSRRLCVCRRTGGAENMPGIAARCSARRIGVLESETHASCAVFERDSKKMERYAKAAGIKASCHSLRHTFASNLLEEGAEVISIKELLGHASMESSERYAKLSNQRVKQVYLQTIRKVIAK